MRSRCSDAGGPGVGADRGEGPRRRVHDPGDQRRPHGRVPCHRPTTTPTATTATRGRERAAWARSRCPRPALPFMASGHYARGLRDHRARHRAPRRRRAPLQRGDEQRLLRDRGGGEGDRVQRPLRGPRVHEHHEPVQRQLAARDGADRGGRAARSPMCRCATSARWCSTSCRPTTRCARARHTSSRSIASASKRTAATCSSPRPSRALQAPIAPSGTSRAVALASTAPTLEAARERVATAAASVPVLEWRTDVGDGRYLEGLRRLVAGRAASAEPALPKGP